MTVLYNTQDSHSDVTIDDLSSSRVALAVVIGFEPPSENGQTRVLHTLTIILRFNVNTKVQLLQVFLCNFRTFLNASLSARFKKPIS